MLAQGVDKALALEADKRWQSADEMKSALRTPSAPPKPTPPKPKLPGATLPGTDITSLGKPKPGGASNRPTWMVVGISFGVLAVVGLLTLTAVAVVLSLGQGASAVATNTVEPTETVRVTSTVKPINTTKPSSTLVPSTASYTATLASTGNTRFTEDTGLTSAWLTVTAQVQTLTVIAQSSTPTVTRTPLPTFTRTPVAAVASSTVPTFVSSPTPNTSSQSPKIVKVWLDTQSTFSTSAYFYVQYSGLDKNSDYGFVIYSPDYCPTTCSQPGGYPIHSAFFAPSDILRHPSTNNGEIRIGVSLDQIYCNNGLLQQAT